MRLFPVETIHIVSTGNTFWGRLCSSLFRTLNHACSAETYFSMLKHVSIVAVQDNPLCKAVCMCTFLFCMPFQTLGRIYSVLTDKDKRAIYDEDGTVDEESSIFDQVLNEREREIDRQRLTDRLID